MTTVITQSLTSQDKRMDSLERIIENSLHHVLSKSNFSKEKQLQVIKLVSNDLSYSSSKPQNREEDIT